MRSLKFAERLIELRKEKGLSQRKFAQRFNVSKSTVSMWEIGKNIPDLYMLIDIAKFFDVSTDDLLGILD
ncbi:MAG: helix-turn-helix domain-containing protein [Clostridiales bacterium]|nr:helix-turn-helix domain-containing protein [Clostridiales bacterium]